MQKAKSKKKKGTKNVLKLIIIGVILVVLVIGFYYYLSHRTDRTKGSTSVEITKTQEVLAYNFDERYPSTPKEVVKLYSDITQCFYNEEHTDEEIEQLAFKIQRLYDVELIANQPEEIYIQSLKEDIASMKKSEYVVSSYSVSASTDVDYFKDDGYEWARLHCVYGIRKGTSLGSTKEQFLLRKDSEGYWKIYGWKLVVDQ